MCEYPNERNGVRRRILTGKGRLSAPLIRVWMGVSGSEGGRDAQPDQKGPS